MAPKYIADLLQPYTPTRQLRSSSKNLLVTPKSNLKFCGDRSFQVAAPRLWNSLTDDIRSIHWLIELADYPFFFLLYIFSLLNLSKSNVSYLLEINFYNCYIFSLITQRFLIFRITIIVKRHWAHGNGAIYILVFFFFFFFFFLLLLKYNGCNTCTILLDVRKRNAVELARVNTWGTYHQWENLWLGLGKTADTERLRKHKERDSQTVKWT